MNLADLLALVIVGLVVVVGYGVVTPYYPEEAKQERCRRRSNSRLTSRAKRPMVKFSVRTKKRKD
jgi:hypothetical protein